MHLFGRESQRLERRLEQPGHHGLPGPAQTQTGQGDAELTGRQVGIQVLQHVLREPGRFPPGSLRCLDLRQTDFDQRELGRNEKAVGRDQQQDEQDLPDHDGPGLSSISARMTTEKRRPSRRSRPWLASRKGRLGKWVPLPVAFGKEESRHRIRYSSAGSTTSNDSTFMT